MSQQTLALYASSLLQPLGTKADLTPREQATLPPALGLFRIVFGAC